MNSPLLWTFALGWFGIQAASFADFTVVHEIFSFPKHIEGAAIKEVALFFVLQ